MPKGATSPRTERSPFKGNVKSVSGGGQPLNVRAAPPNSNGSVPRKSSAAFSPPPTSRMSAPNTEEKDREMKKFEDAEDVRRKKMMEEKMKAVKAAEKVEKHMKVMEEQEEKNRAAHKGNKRHSVRKPVPGGRKRTKAPLLDLKKHLNGHGMLTKYDGSIRRRNLGLFILTLLAIVVNITQLELGYRDWTTNDDTKDLVSNTLKCAVWIISFVQVGLIWDYYRLQSKVETIRFALDLGSISMGRWVFVWPAMAWKAFLESLIYFLYPVPFLELIEIHDRFCPVGDCETNEDFPTEETYVVPWVDDKFALCMFLRLYIILRVVRDYSQVYRTRTTIVEKLSDANSKNTLSGKDFNWLLTIKYMISVYPVQFVPLLSSSALLLFAYCVHVCERTVSLNFHDMDFGYGDSVWFMFITMSTIGYGDRSPVTTEGRLVTMMAGCAGLVATALLTMVVLDKLVLNQSERLHTVTLERHLIHLQQRDCCARYIQVRWRERAYLKACIKEGNVPKPGKQKMYQTKKGKLLKTMRQLRLSLRELEPGIPIEEIVRRINIMEQMLDPDGRKRESIQRRSQS